jgi:hypothetical protein
MEHRRNNTPIALSTLLSLASLPSLAAQERVEPPSPATQLALTRLDTYLAESTAFLTGALAALSAATPVSHWEQLFPTRAENITATFDETQLRSPTADKDVHAAVVHHAIGSLQESEEAKRIIIDKVTAALPPEIALGLRTQTATMTISMGTLSNIEATSSGFTFTPFAEVNGQRTYYPDIVNRTSVNWTEFWDNTIGDRSHKTLGYRTQCTSFAKASVSGTVSIFCGNEHRKVLSFDAASKEPTMWGRIDITSWSAFGANGKQKTYELGKNAPHVKSKSCAALFGGMEFTIKTDAAGLSSATTAVRTKLMDQMPIVTMDSLKALTTDPLFRTVRKRADSASDAARRFELHLGELLNNDPARVSQLLYPESLGRAAPHLPQPQDIIKRLEHDLTEGQKISWLIDAPRQLSTRVAEIRERVIKIGTGSAKRRSPTWDKPLALRDPSG